MDARAISAVDPRGVVLRSFGELLAPDSNRAAFRKLLSRRSVHRSPTAIDFERAQRAIINGLTRQELPFEVGADLLFSNVRVNVEGDDAQGYRVQLRAAGDTQSFYVVKEDGAYRILTVAPMVGPLALHGAGAARSPMTSRARGAGWTGRGSSCARRIPRIRSRGRRSRACGPWASRPTWRAPGWPRHCC